MNDYQLLDKKELSYRKMNKDLQKRFEVALESEDAGSCLWKLAHDLRDEGLTQVDLYHLYEHYQQMTDSEDLKYDAILDTMDIIWGGGWAKGSELYDNELTDTEINKHG